jgi:C-terminal processing protease CtpA/Prc
VPLLAGSDLDGIPGGRAPETGPAREVQLLEAAGLSAAEAREAASPVQQPHYSGKVVILVDEISLSQAEYTTMAFRSSPQAMVVGSTTAGADGNVSQVVLPGGLNTMISGIGVFYPDKRPTQRVGILPDVEVRPTIAGIRAGRDEVLEEALRQILGRQTPADQIEKMARGL